MNIVSAPVTILALCGWRSACLVRLGVVTLPISLLCAGMALRTRQLFGRRLVGRRLDIRMTVHTTEQGAVDGMFQFNWIDGNANRLPAHLLRQACIGVTSETVFILRLLRSICDTSPRQEEECDDRGTDLSSRIHAIEQMLIHPVLAVTSITLFPHANLASMLGSRHFGAHPSGRAAWMAGKLADDAR